MPDRLTRYAPLTGVIAVVLFAVGAFSGSEPPGSNSSTLKVIHYYAVHRSEVETTSVLIGISVIFLMLFAATLRSYLRRTAAAEGPAALVLAGMSILAATGLLAVGIEYGLAHHLAILTPSSLQAANIVAQEVFVPILGGMALTAFGSFLAIRRGAPLPAWVAWLALVVAILTIIPPIGFVGFLAFMVWALIVSILMFRRTDSPAGERPARPPEPAAQAG